MNRIGSSLQECEPLCKVLWSFERLDRLGAELKSGSDEVEGEVARCGQSGETVVDREVGNDGRRVEVGEREGDGRGVDERIGELEVAE